MKRYFPKNAEDASALILTLLVIVLLSTIVTSFLSSTRTEQTATRNYTSKTQAEMLVNNATQQAMAKIQQGFTVNGNATTVITTQPGAIRQFVFSSGTISSNSTQELFSGTGNASTNGTVNLNNLQNPGNSTSTATSNQWTITGNASEMINVYMENVNGTVNGSNQTVGRIAYYVDDEGTKINVNAATGNRTTLNVGTRPQDIAALVSATQATSFAAVVNSSTTNTTSVTGWSHFFRPEQVSAAVSGISGNNTPFLATATTSASSTANMAHLLTPWGTQRLFINELPITTVGVNRSFTSLTGIASPGNTTNDLKNGQALQNIYGGNFSTKYTSLGVKQIAANILQMRDPNTFSISASGNYSGALLGGTNLDANDIPTEYLGYAPYPVISEVGFSCTLCYEPSVKSTTNTTTNTTITTIDPVIRISIQPTVELYNPYPTDFIFQSGYPRLLIAYKDLSFDLIYTYNGTTQNKTVKSGVALGVPFSGSAGGISWNPQLIDASVIYDALAEFLPKISNKPYIPAKTKIQTHFQTTAWGTRFELKLLGGNSTKVGSSPASPYPYAVTINGVSNATIELNYVKLLANSNNGSADIYSGHNATIRDWVTGNETGLIKADIKPWMSLPWTNAGVLIGPGLSVVPTNSASRVSFFNRYPLSTIPTGNGTNWYNPLPGAPTWSVNASTIFGNQGNSITTNPNSSSSYTSTLSGMAIPSDPSFNNEVSSAVYAGSNATDMREPFLLTGTYTCPADLGFVPTNQRWRRLRMQMQPALEGNLIPDWAMLDVISFGNSTNASNPFTRQHPVNINGRFYLPGNASITPRTTGLRALAKVLENSNTGTIQDPMNPASSNSADTMRFRGNTVNATTIASAISNMTWSVNSTWGNSTSNSTSFRRNALKFPVNQYILPSEIMEIAGVADAVSQGNYTNTASHFKWNEGRASALIPAVTTRSSFFTIYAYAQALDKSGNVDSEHLTKTLVEVQYNSGNYSVKKLYTQPILLED